MDNKKDDNKLNHNLKPFVRSKSFSNYHSNYNDIPGPIKTDLNISTKNISSSIIFQKLIKEKGKEALPTIFEEKYMKKSSKKLSKLISSNSDIKNICDVKDSLIENLIDDNSDFLQVRKIKRISDEEFEILKNEIIGHDDLDIIYDDFINENIIPLNEIDFSANIGCILPFRFLVESLFDSSLINVEEMNYRYELFNKYIFNYRRIKGDGNCFYRAIIFRYIELVILNKKIELLKSIINEMHESFKSNEVSSRMRIRHGFILNYKLVLLIMIIILNLLENGTIEDAHYFYVKSIVICDSFDYGLILYFRYIFYLYIKKNENKIYLKNFPIKIANLLPSNFETEQGLSLFNKFYYLYLLSMFTDAEKIIIHLTPFVLGINLDVIIFDDNEDKTIKNMIYDGEPDYDFKEDKFFVINVNGHYELLYTQNDNDKYKGIFQNYINDYYSNILINNNNNNTNDFSPEEDKEMQKKNSENNIIRENEPKNNDNDVDLNINSDTKIATTLRSPIKIENNIIKNDEKNNNKDNKEIKRTYKVQIKTINKTAKKINDGFSKRNEELESIKYSEKKEMNYKNLINNKINENNNNNNFKNNSDKKSDYYKNKEINNIKINLMDKIKNSNNNLKNVKENDEIKSPNNLINSNKNDKPKLSNIINSQKYNRIINKYKCEICKRNNLKNIKNDLFSNICYNCLKENIINKLSPLFISYIEDLIFNKMQDLAFKTYFNNFLEMKIDIFDNNISIKDLLNELDNKAQTKSKESESIEMHPLFQEIKKNFCIFCLNDIGEEKYEIPCKCNFCSIDHIKKYFHLKNHIYNKANFICICSHEYSNEDMYNIGLFFNEIKLYSLRENAIEFLNRNYLERQCCFCCASIETSNRNRICIKDFEDENILGDSNKLKHFICKSCWYQYQQSVETFSCFVCNKNHIVVYKYLSK